MKKVLITEDDLVSNLLLSALIRDHGFATVSAYSIADAKKLLDADVFQFVFIDNKLPDGLGIDFIPEIRSKQANAKVVVISAENFEDNIKRAYAHGADAFLSKPLSHAEIKKVLALVGNGE